MIAERAVQHDAGVIEEERLHPYQAGHVPFFNPTPELGYAVRPDLLERVRARLEGLELAPLSAAAGGTGRRPKLVYGTILAGDQFIHCEATRARLHREFEAQAVAMEGAALAQVAERLGVPWLEIRALSDLAGKDSRFDFAKFVDEVAKSSAQSSCGACCRDHGQGQQVRQPQAIRRSPRCSRMWREVAIGRHRQQLLRRFRCSTWR